MVRTTTKWRGYSYSKRRKKALKSTLRNVLPVETITFQKLLKMYKYNYYINTFRRSHENLVCCLAHSEIVCNNYCLNNIISRLKYY